MKLLGVIVWALFLIVASAVSQVYALHYIYEWFLVDMLKFPHVPKLFWFGLVNFLSVLFITFAKISMNKNHDGYGPIGSFNTNVLSLIFAEWLTVGCCWLVLTFLYW